METETKLTADAITRARDLVEINIASGDVDDDTAMIVTGGMIGDIAALLTALQSIAKNTCCDGCREAALVARKALGNDG